MPTNAQGGLVVSLGLDATEYTRGLTKAEYEAKKFATSFEKGMGTLRSGLKALGIGLIVNEIYEMGKAVVNSAANLSDLADATGSSVENLSKLDNQARISGASFNELQDMVLKLATGMGGVDERSQRVQRTLKFLGVTAKDPAEALQQVVVALNKYADGAGKAALARDLFDRGGAKFLATLKDMAQLQDVTATVTTKQAEEAEKLQKQIQLLQVQFDQFSKLVLSDVVPVLNNLIGRFIEARKAGLGLGEALAIGLSDVNAADEVKRLTGELDKLEKQQAEFERSKAAGTGFTGFVNKITGGNVGSVNQGTIDSLRNQLATQKRLAEAAYMAARPPTDRGDKPEIQVPGRPGRAGRGAAIPKDRVSDAQRYLDQLEQQLQKTQELTTVERILADVESGRLKLSADVPLQRILAVGELIDAAKEQERIQRANQKLAEDEARTREQTARIKERSIKAAQEETLALAQQNQQMKDEIEIIGKDEAQIAAIAQARLDNAINAKQEALAIAQNLPNMEAEAGHLQDQIRLLQERKGLLLEKGQREQIAKQQQEAAEEAKRFNDIFVESFADAATAVATHTQNIGDAVKSMERTIVDPITRIAAKKLAESIFGSIGGGTGGNFLGTMMQSLFGGGTGSFSFAAGGMPPANRPVLVGERGPELFVPRQTGTIIPNSELIARRSQRAGDINISINVPGNVSRSTANQIAVQTAAQLRRATAKDA